jgi:hypothetical protein
MPRHIVLFQSVCAPSDLMGLSHRFLVEREEAEVAFTLPYRIPMAVQFAEICQLLGTDRMRYCRQWSDSGTIARLGAWRGLSPNETSVFGSDHIHHSILPQL